MAKIKSENGGSYESNSIFDIFSDKSKEIAQDKQTEDAMKQKVMAKNDEVLARMRSLVDSLAKPDPNADKKQQGLDDSAWLARLRKEGGGR